MVFPRGPPEPALESGHDIAIFARVPAPNLGLAAGLGRRPNLNGPRAVGILDFAVAQAGQLARHMAEFNLPGKRFRHSRFEKLDPRIVFPVVDVATVNTAHEADARLERTALPPHDPPQRH